LIHGLGGRAILLLTLRAPATGFIFLISSASAAATSPPTSPIPFEIRRNSLRISLTRSHSARSTSPDGRWADGLRS
jgi:hypothetical protein